MNKFGKAWQDMEKLVLDDSMASERTFQRLDLSAVICLLSPDLDAVDKREVSEAFIKKIKGKYREAYMLYRFCEAIESIPLRDRNCEKYGIISHSKEAADKVWEYITQQIS
jgi:hypothetical protein